MLYSVLGVEEAGFVEVVKGLGKVIFDLGFKDREVVGLGMRSKIKRRGLEFSCVG